MIFMTIEEEIRIAITEGNIIIGSKEVIKVLKTKDLKLIILANNCPARIKKDISYYTKLSGVQVKEFDGSAKDLGIICGKPFAIATLAIK